MCCLNEKKQHCQTDPQKKKKEENSECQSNNMNITKSVYVGFDCRFSGFVVQLYFILMSNAFLQDVNFISYFQWLGAIKSVNLSVFCEVKSLDRCVMFYFTLTPTGLIAPLYMSSETYFEID